VPLHLPYGVYQREHEAGPSSIVNPLSG